MYTEDHTTLLLRHGFLFVLRRFKHPSWAFDKGYGRPVSSVVFEPVARVTLYLTDENGLGTCFGAP